jgi:cytochrome c-type biogenesis protein CcmH
MMIWLIFCLMMAATIMLVLWPLSRARHPDMMGAGDAAFYKDQLNDILRDEARGLIQPQEAKAAHIEAARRLLAAQKLGAELFTWPAPSLARKRAAALFILCLIPLITFGVYGLYGAPSLADRPLSKVRAAQGPTLDDAVARIEQHLIQSPNDGRGWDVVAPVYARSGRFEDAAQAYDKAIALLGPSAPRLVGLGESLVQAQQGLVPAKAREAFERALKLDPHLPQARFYTALADEQEGASAKALAGYQALITSAPIDAAWLPLVQTRYDALLKISPPSSPSTP